MELIKGYHEDNEAVCLDKARNFINDDDEDCWVEVIPVSGTNMYVVQTYQKCQRTHTSLVKESDDMWKEIEMYVQAVMN